MNPDNCEAECVTSHKRIESDADAARVVSAPLDITSWCRSNADWRLAFCIFLQLASFVGCQGPSSGDRDDAGSESAAHAINVRFPIPVVRPSLAPFFFADEKGWYRENGVAPEFHFGNETTNPVAMVLAGADDIGVMGGPDSVLVAIGKGAPFVIVAVLHQSASMPCVITLKDSGITELRQLEGKRVGMFPGHVSTDVLRAWFRKENVNVQEVPVGYDYSQFLTSKVDAQWAFTTAAAVELPEKGVEINVLNPSSSGITTHGFTIFCTRDFAAKHHQEMKGFLKATFRGVIETSRFPQDAAALVVARDSTGNLRLDQSRSRVDQYNRFTAADNPCPPGYCTGEMLVETYERLAAQGLIEKPFNPEDAVDTSFLDEIHGTERMRAGCEARERDSASDDGGE